jgi:hypothetical protein
MRKNPAGWTAAQTDTMHWLQRSTLKSARGDVPVSVERVS